MFLKENILLAIAGLKTNKMRSLLTMLGIIIGISSVIGIVSVGNSLTMSFKDTMSSFGSNNVILYIREKGVGDQGGPPSYVGSGYAEPEESDLMSEEQIVAFEEYFGDRIQSIGLVDNIGSAKAQDGRLYANANVIGASAGYQDTANLDLVAGRFLDDKDIKSNRNVAVVSDVLVKNMFPGGMDPLGQEVKLYGSKGIDTFLIVGVYDYVAPSYVPPTSSEKDTRTDVYVPISVAKEQSVSKNYSSFTVKVVRDEDPEKFTRDAQKYMEKLYADNVKWEMSAMNMEDTISTVADFLGTISIAVAVIAGISLLVGGIGVMNIMLVSVTERTREIGIRKALGARSSYIQIQFIVEAVIICFIGGIIGIVLGIAMGAVGSTILGMPPAISIPIIFISVVFSMAIGVFFGFYPASKAAKLDPIDALRYE